jgi:histidinol dehydrogenase
MVGVPAKVSGCERLIVTTPPSSDGAIRDSVLVAANEVGVDEIYKLGGAQAIGAMAFGSESIIPVSKVFGAGNTYVTSAKMQVFGDVDIDMPAGPSEVMVIADDSADARYIAADLISQCEHGEESAAVLITDSADFAEKVSTQTVKQANELRTGETIIKSLNNYGAIILVEDINDSVEIANDYAPEHLEIVTRNYNQISKEIKNAGSIFLGEYSSEPAGDYATGTNHVLPTNGYAKMFSGLSIDSFGKWIQFQELTKEGLDKIRSAVDTLAEEENLPAHANAVNIRFEEDE